MIRGVLRRRSRKMKTALFSTKNAEQNAVVDYLIRTNQVVKYGLSQFIDSQTSLSSLENDDSYADLAHRQKKDKLIYDELLIENKARPSLLTPLVGLAARLGGAGSLLFGKEKSKNIAVTMEKMLEDYTDETLRVLSHHDINDEKLKTKIKEIRDSNYKKRQRVNSDADADAEQCLDKPFKFLVEVTKHL